MRFVAGGLIIGLVCVSVAQPFAVAQAAPAPLPPAAQEALDKGIIAAKVPDYPLAIRYFEEARKAAPEAPVVYLNLGIAESKIPGRELRAMAWFGAYLAAFPQAPNAAAVREQITALDVRNQSNVSRFIKSTQDAAGQMRETWGSERDVHDLAKLWAEAGGLMRGHPENRRFISGSELEKRHTGSHRRSPGKERGCGWRAQNVCCSASDG